MTDETGWHTRQLQAALRARGCVGRCVDLADCRIDTTARWHGLVIPGFGRELPDAALVRGIAGGSFEQVTKRLGVLHALRELGVPVYNDARAIERSVDKSMTSLLLHAAQHSHAADLGHRVAGAGAAHRDARGRGRPRAGAQAACSARRARACSGWATWTACTTRCRHIDRRLRRRWPTCSASCRRSRSPGFDWRVLVVGGRAVTAMRRVSAHWVHNVAQGARCEPAERRRLARELAQTAEAAALALGMDYAGVDLIPWHRKPARQRTGIQVLEVNGVAAWQGLQRVTGFNIAARHRRRPARTQARAHAGRRWLEHVATRVMIARQRRDNRCRGTASPCDRPGPGVLPARLRARCGGAQAGQREPGFTRPRHARRDVHRQRAGRGRGRCSSPAHVSASASRQPLLQPGRWRAATPIWASCCCARRSRRPWSGTPKPRRPTR